MMTAYRDGDTIVAPRRAEGPDAIGDAFVRLAPGTDEYDLWDGWLRQQGDTVDRPEPGDTHHTVHSGLSKVDRPEVYDALGLDNLGTAEVNPADVHVDRTYQRPVDPARLDLYSAEPNAALAAQWGLLAQRSDGSYWVVDGQHHTLAAAIAGIPALPYRVFTSTGPDQEARVYARWRGIEGRNQVGGA